MRIDGLDWLLQFAADEQSRQGVKRATADEGDVKEANCTAVAGLNMEWDFTSRAWQAEFVEGPLKGTKKRFGVYDLTKDRVDKMEKAGILQADTNVKDKARDVMLIWCDNISKGNDTFEVEWELTETQGPACTPVKKGRKR